MLECLLLVMGDKHGYRCLNLGMVRRCRDCICISVGVCGIIGTSACIMVKCLLLSLLFYISSKMHGEYVIVNIFYNPTIAAPRLNWILLNSGSLMLNWNAGWDRANATAICRVVVRDHGERVCFLYKPDACSCY